MIDIRKSVLSDGLAIKLRPDDEREAMLYLRGEPPEGLIGSIAATGDQCVTVLDRATGEVLAIGGVFFDEEAQLACPWMMCSAGIDRHRVALGRILTNIVEAFPDLRRHGYTVGNYIGKESAAARKFVQRIGGKIIPSPGAGSFDFFHFPGDV